jgi:hypothetical protein
LTTAPISSQQSIIDVSVSPQDVADLCRAASHRRVTTFLPPPATLPSDRSSLHGEENAAYERGNHETASLCSSGIGSSPATSGFSEVSSNLAASNSNEVGSELAVAESRKDAGSHVAVPESRNKVGIDLAVAGPSLCKEGKDSQAGLGVEKGGHATDHESRNGAQDKGKEESHEVGSNRRRRSTE